MIKLGFKPHYRVVHLVKEFGPVRYGGVYPSIEQQYRFRDESTGFIHYRNDPDFDIADYDGRQDVAIATAADAGKLHQLDFDVLAVHLYELANFVTPEVLAKAKLVNVVHGIPTPEPMPKAHPFGGHEDVEQWFGRLCQHASMIICLSQTEVVKLGQIWPEYASKTTFVHGALPLPEHVDMRIPDGSRNKLGFIGRMDYRKGLLETLKIMRHFDFHLHIASNVDDKPYLQRINEYIAAASLESRVHWHGFCVERRKQAFFELVDAVVVPSLYEPFGYVVIEPIVAGTPVITANNGGMAEIIGDYAYQFHPYALHEQRDAIARFLADPPETIERETSELMKLVRERCDSRKMVEKYRALFESLG